MPKAYTLTYVYYVVFSLLKWCPWDLMEGDSLGGYQIDLHATF